MTFKCIVTYKILIITETSIRRRRNIYGYFIIVKAFKAEFEDLNHREDLNL
jgi:hypothetical protein